MRTYEGVNPIRLFQLPRMFSVFSFRFSHGRLETTSLPMAILNPPLSIPRTSQAYFLQNSSVPVEVFTEGGYKGEEKQTYSWVFEERKNFKILGQFTLTPDLYSHECTHHSVHTRTKLTATINQRENTKTTTRWKIYIPSICPKTASESPVIKEKKKHTNRISSINAR